MRNQTSWKWLKLWSTCAFSASRPAGVCVEESFEDEELQVSRQEDDQALARRPPGDVVEVGQEEVLILPFPHAGEVVMTPHVEDLILELLYALLNTGQSAVEDSLSLLQLPLWLLKAFVDDAKVQKDPDASKLVVVVPKTHPVKTCHLSLEVHLTDGFVLWSHENSLRWADRHKQPVIIGHPRYPLYLWSHFKSFKRLLMQTQIFGIEG